MADVYPDGTDQRISDPEWIKRADTEGWVALTKDPSIVRDHRDVLVETKLRVFAFNNASITGAEMVTRLEINFNRILQEVEEAWTLPVGNHARWPTTSVAEGPNERRNR